MLIQSTNPQDILSLFRADRYEAHVQVYREQKWLSDMKAWNAAAMDRVMAELSQIHAERRARV